MTSIDAAISKLDTILSALGVSDAPPAAASAAPSINSAPDTAPAQPATPSPAPVTTPSPAAPTPEPAAAVAPKAAKPSKPSKEAPAAAAPSDGPNPQLFSQAQLVVARVLSVDEVPDSDKLYKLQIDVGGGETRRVVSGIKQYVPRFSLVQQHVVVILNLKAAKLAGILSQAMVLAGEGNGAVKLLVPPSDSVAGDQVYLTGGSKPESYPKTLKSDKWRLIAGELHKKDGCATYAGTALVTDRGNVTLPEEIPDGAEIR